MSDIEFIDVSNAPRSMRDLEDALNTIQTEIVRGNPGAVLKDGTPAVMCYIVVSDALRELIALRNLIAKLKEKKESHGKD